jgi:hypothetical protein
MDSEQLTDFIAAIPDLVAHRFMDTDGYFSTKIHNQREVAVRVANALSSAGYVCSKPTH